MSVSLQKALRRYRGNQRAMDLMVEAADENDRLTQALEAAEAAIKQMIIVKDHKDRFDKTDWYLRHQPKAWEGLRQALAEIERIRNESGQ